MNQAAINWWNDLSVRSQWLYIHRTPAVKKQMEGGKSIDAQLISQIYNKNKVKRNGR